MDNVYDWVRLFNLILGLVSLLWCAGGWFKQHTEWNTKTLDFWYSRMMWSVVQCVLSVEGIRQHAGLTTGLVCITIAGLVTFKGLYKKGTWGYVA